jgi:hypothetical protein
MVITRQANSTIKAGHRRKQRRQWTIKSVLFMAFSSKIINKHSGFKD